MRKKTHFKHLVQPLLAGLVVGLISLFLTVQLVAASNARQDDQPVDVTPVPEEAEGHTEGRPGYYTTEECQECHLDVSSHWEPSPHANAYSDPVFQERWMAMAQPGECLACHTTNYIASTGEFDAEGISCQACHGQVGIDHPPAPVAILADTEYCGTCHTTTLGEWRTTAHSTADIGCSACHDPHSQQALFEDPDDMCINCHADSMDHYLEDIHYGQGIGCVDCHALVIPPEVPPVDGIVPTGHAFTITAGTCVACHTDALHAGFSLPGYEEGASAAHTQDVSNQADAEVGAEDQTLAEQAEEATGLSPQQQIQALESALSAQNATLLFQGGLIGLVLGGSTAWIVSTNTQRREQEEAEDEAETEEEVDDEG
jgi:predicted CXXCH cytochrome family protein